jgi:hypothetical protein
MTDWIFLEKFDRLVEREPVRYPISISAEDYLGIREEIVHNFVTQPPAIRIL